MKAPKPIKPGKWETIALIGMAPSARELIPHIPPDVGIFTIGAAWNMPELPRLPDVAVEIHQRWLLSHPNYSPGLWAWLQQPHPFPVFTYKRSQEVPASVQYPIKWLIGRFLYGIARGEDEQQVRFFTSSLDYLMALALAYEPTRIEVYGFDMATDTEYRYQREGGSFWYGMAAGLGVELWMPENSPMLKSKLYAYQGSQWIRAERLTQLLEQMKAGMEKAETKYRALETGAPKLGRRKPKPEDIEYFQQLDRVRDAYYLYSGAAQTIEQFVAEFAIEGFMTRQEIERIRSYVLVGKNHHISKLNWNEGMVTTKKNAMIQAKKDKSPDAARIEAEFEDALKIQNQARMDYFVHNGSSQVISHLIDECDLQADTEFRPVMDIVSIDMNSGSSTEAMVRPTPNAVDA